MKEIAIEYPFLFFFKRRAFGQLPTSWAELSERQLLAIAGTLGGAEPDHQFLSDLTGIRLKLVRRLSPIQLKAITDQLEFIATAGNSHSDFFVKELKGCKTIKGSNSLKGRNLAAPRRKLDGMPFGQFIFVDSYYNDWIATGKQEALNHFVASLYLLPGETFDQRLIESRVALVSSVDLDIRKAIAFNYGLVIRWLQKAYPLIFHQVGEDNHTKDDSPSGKALANSPWITIFESLVGDDLINRDRYATLPVHAVFRYMTTKYKENARK